jgi:hypothetical protein
MELWIEAADRAAINAAVEETDRHLANNPSEAGKRSENIRVLFCSPLGVFFEIDGARDVVDVLRVWTF